MMSETEKAKKELVKFLYPISVDNIAQLKNRQWEVTKWVLAANVALFIPIAIRENELPDTLLKLIAAVSFVLAALAFSLIVSAQYSLCRERGALDRYKADYGPPFRDIDPPPERFSCKWFERHLIDFFIWAPMLAVATLSSVATIAAALAVLCQRGP
jgi:hypothetical protein